MQKIKLAIKYGIQPKKPIYLARLLKALLKSKFGKQIQLRGVDFAIDYACNMKCEHCFDQRLKNESRKKMEIQDYERVASEAMALGCTYFGFQGGELFLRKDYLDIIEAVKPRKNRITVTSNGLVVDEEKIIALKKVGVDYINFSLDSGIAAEHDKFRGVEGSFDKTMNAMKICKRYKMPFTINTTISHFNVLSDGFKKVADFASQEKVLINTLFAAPSGNWENNLSVLLDESDINYYYTKRKKYPTMVRDLENGFKKGCPAAKEVLYITPYGDVLGCPLIHISLGNIFAEKLKTIRQRGLENEYLGNYHSMCLIAEDRDFIDKYLSNLDKDTSLPIFISETNF